MVIGQEKRLVDANTIAKNHLGSLSQEVSRSVGFLSVRREWARVIWPGLSGVVFGAPQFARGLRSSSFAPSAAAAVLDHENGGTCENGRTSPRKRKKSQLELVED